MALEDFSLICEVNPCLWTKRSIQMSVRRHLIRGLDTIVFSPKSLCLWEELRRSWVRDDGTSGQKNETCPEAEQCGPVWQEQRNRSRHHTVCCLQVTAEWRVKETQSNRTQWGLMRWVGLRSGSLTPVSLRREEAQEYHHRSALGQSEV